jgi:hypothetical protein
VTQTKEEIEEELITLKHRFMAAAFGHDRAALWETKMRMAALSEILARRSHPALSTNRRNKGGAPPAADWPAIEEKLAAEIDLVGFPHRKGAEGWRTQADVVRFVEQLTGDAEPGKTALKQNVKRMLAEIRQKKGQKVGN